MTSAPSVAAPVVVNISRLFMPSVPDFMLLGYDGFRVPYLISRRSLGKLLVAAPLARAPSDDRNMFLSLNSVLLETTPRDGTFLGFCGYRKRTSPSKRYDVRFVETWFQDGKFTNH